MSDAKKRRLRLMCQVLLVLNLAYTVAAVLLERLPGWKMFFRVEPLAFTLTDRNHETLNPYHFIPRSSYLQNMAQVRSIASFICESDPARSPLVLEDRLAGSRSILSYPDCEARAYP